MSSATNNDDVKKDPKKKNISGKPYDPSRDFGQMIGDAAGLSGITQNLQDDNDAGKGFKAPEDNDLQGLSKAKVPSAQHDIGDPDDDQQEAYPQDQDYRVNPSDQQFTDVPTGNEISGEEFPPYDIGEQEVSGSMPDPASDDDTLLNSHKVGLRLNEDEEHPQELDIASDVDKAEEYHRKH